MKTVILSFLTLLMCQSVFSQSSNTPTITVDYQPASMHKYEYEADNGYIVERDHTNYHIPLSDTKTLIIKVLKSADALNQGDAVVKTFAFKDLNNISTDFIQRVNKGKLNIVVRIPSEQGTQYLQADKIILRTFTNNEMTYYAAPFFTVAYQLSGDYYPGESVQGLGYTDRFESRFFFYGQTEVKGIKNNVLLKIYNDVCAKRPYGVTTPRSPKGQDNPYKKMVSSKTGERLYRSCQHPIQAEYLEGIGLYKEFYEEDGKTYVTQLVSIDDMPIEDYINQVSKYSDVGESQPAPTLNTDQPEELPFFQPAGFDGEETVFGFANTPKGGSITGSKIQPLAQSFTKKSVDKAALPKPSEQIIHKVGSGETLYRLSKMYNTTVENLQDMNGLNSNVIEVNQELIVRQSD